MLGLEQLENLLLLHWKVQGADCFQNNYDDSAEISSVYLSVCWEMQGTSCIDLMAKASVSSCVSA